MSHDPDPRFLEHLEWQTERALRRRDRFSRPVPTGALRTVRTLALVLLCTFSGAGFVVAAERIQSVRQAEILLERNRVEGILAEHRVARATESAERAEVLFASGLVGEGRVEEARLAFEQATWDWQHLELDRVEIANTGRAPNLEITAPLAGGRDIFSERERLARDLTVRELEISNRELQRTEELAAAGVVSSADVGSLRVEIEDAGARLQAHKARLALRADQVLGRITDEAALRADRLTAVELRGGKARRQVATLEVELKRLRELVDLGVVSGSEIRALEDRLETAETAHKLAELERQLIAEGS